jgi:hypothetical protein
MKRLNNSDTFRWSILLALAILAAVILALSPEEATLGANVRIVVLHVALTRTGLVGLALAGLIGLALLISPATLLDDWAIAISRVGLGFYVGGFLVSFVAQVVIWGGFAMQEPRTVAAMNVLAAAAIVQVLITWLPQQRIHGGLHAALLAVVAWGLVSAQNVLHPEAAISAGAASVRLYAYALLAVCLAAAAWITWGMRRGWSAARPRPAPDHAG